MDGGVEQVRIGALRHRVTFQRLTVTQDDYGGTVKSWVDHATVWAVVEYLSGRELWQAQQANSEASGRVRIRHREDIEPTMRIVHGSKYLEIITVLPVDSKDREMHLLFKEALD